MTTPIGDPLALYIANLKALQTADALPDDVKRHMDSVNRQAAYWLKQAAKAKPATPKAPKQYWPSLPGGQSETFTDNDKAADRISDKQKRAEHSLWDN